MTLLETKVSLRRVWKLLGATLLGGVLLLALSAVFVAWTVRSAAPKPLQLTDARLAVLRRDPHVIHYAARRYDDLPSGSVLRRLPRYMAISILTAYFRLAPNDYAQTVAHCLPIRVSDTPPTVVVGLDAAAGRLFQCEVRDIPLEQIRVLMEYGASPLQFPVIDLRLDDQ